MISLDLPVGLPTFHVTIHSLNRNCNLKISKALLKRHAHQLIHERCDESKGVFQKEGQEKLLSDFQNTGRGQSSC